MTEEKIKLQIMKLWKETFHDSDDYVNLVFENYYNPKFVSYKIQNDKIVSALLGVPYRFSSKQQDVDFKGLYLCGLCTAPECRRQGIMSELIEEINCKANAEGYDFTFLIPADSGLQKYYSDRGYIKSFYDVNLRYTSVHDFRNELNAVDSEALSDFDVMSVKSWDEISDVQNVNDLQAVLDYLVNYERNKTYLSINHTSEDFRIIAEENRTSEEAGVFVCYDKDNSPVGVCWNQFTKDDEIKVQCLYYNNFATRYKLLEHVKKSYPQKPMIVVESAEENNVKNKAVWSPYFVGMNMKDSTDRRVVEKEFTTSDGNDVFSYAMIRIFDVEKFVNCAEENTSENRAAKGIKKSHNKQNDDIFSGIPDKGVEELLMRVPKDGDALLKELDLPRCEIFASLLLE